MRKRELALVLFPVVDKALNFPASIGILEQSKAIGTVNAHIGNDAEPGLQFGADMSDDFAAFLIELQVNDDFVGIE